MTTLALIAKADRRPPGLPGDNRDAEMARSRRTAGLGTAGVGFALATKGKEVAPAVADAITPKWANGPKQVARVASRTKHLASAASKLGGAAVVGGLALAGEGAYSDLRNRQAFSRTHRQARQKVSDTLGKSAAERHVRDMVLAEAFEHEIAKISLGSMTSKIGLLRPAVAVMGKGKLKPVGTALKPIGEAMKPIGTAIGGAAKPIGTAIGGAGKQAVAGFKSLKPTTQLGLAGAGSLGVGLYGGSKLGKSAVDARVRAVTLAKAFDSERTRHSRQDMYSGGAIGGATVAGAGAAASGRSALKAHRQVKPAAAASVASHAEAQKQMAYLGNKPPYKAPKGPTAAGQRNLLAAEHGKTTKTAAEAAALHRSGLEHGTAAGNLARKARRLTRVSAGSALAAAALGGAAYGMHDYDRRSGGRSYGY